MLRHGVDSEHYLKTFFHTFLLAFLAGSVNAGGFMACGRFVTHVTGFSTLFGVDMAEGHWRTALGLLSVPFYFLLGTMLAASLIDRRMNRGLKAGYPIVMGLITVCLLIAALGGHLHFFGVFGGDSNIEQDYFLLAILCGASGLQNAAITTFSGSVVRTTHLTGILTDLGIGLVRTFSNSEDRLHEVRVNWLRIIILSSFTLGSVVGALLFIQLHYLAFLTPAAIAFYAMLVTLRGKDDPQVLV